MRNLNRLRNHNYELIEFTGFEYFVGNDILFVLKYFSIINVPEADK